MMLYTWLTHIAQKSGKRPDGENQPDDAAIDLERRGELGHDRNGDGGTEILGGEGAQEEVCRPLLPTADRKTIHRTS